MLYLYEAEFWVAVAFVIFIALIWRAGAHRSVLSSLDSRRDRIKNELDEARRLKDEAKGLLDQYKAKQREAEREASAILEPGPRRSQRARGRRQAAAGGVRRPPHQAGGDQDRPGRSPGARRRARRRGRSRGQGGGTGAFRYREGQDRRRRAHRRDSRREDAAGLNFPNLNTGDTQPKNENAAPWGGVFVMASAPAAVAEAARTCRAAARIARRGGAAAGGGDALGAALACLGFAFVVLRRRFLLRPRRRRGALRIEADIDDVCARSPLFAGSWKVTSSSTWAKAACVVPCAIVTGTE